MDTRLEEAYEALAVHGISDRYGLVPEIVDEWYRLQHDKRVAAEERPAVLLERIEAMLRARHAGSPLLLFIIMQLAPVIIKILLEHWLNKTKPVI